MSRNRMNREKLNRLSRDGGILFVAAWLVLLNPAAALAQAVDAEGAPTGAPECTGAGCDQGVDQGVDQGTDQGGPTLEDLGGYVDEEGNTVLPEGTEDTRQGATQGSTNGITGTNSTTGSGSTNDVGVDTNSSTTNSVNNAVTDTTNAAATAQTGSNTQSSNTGTAGITTGNAGIGVTQVKNDNTAVIGGTVGLNSSGYSGTHNGDWQLDFGVSTADLTGLSTGSGQAGSIRAINDTTGSDSANNVDIKTRTEEINEVQNDGKIDNLLDLVAITGQNEANKNTGDGVITTGNADIAATLVNLLNTTVINGAILLSVADIFGDLNGNIMLPELKQLAALLPAGGGLEVDAVNEETGADSTNQIDIDVTDSEATNINNDADITTTVNARAVTGQNDALANTGGGLIETGDASVSASNLTLANTTIEGGNWGLVVVNALNRWLGFLVGENGEVRALSQAETIEAMNSGTGAESENNINIETEKNRLTNVNNNAEINNEINAEAVTGQNEASKNTGQGRIATGDANIEATAINIANTTVKDGALFVAVVNIFGDWLGDLLYGPGTTLSAGQGIAQIGVKAENSETGADSENSIDVDVARRQETNINNEAEIGTILNAEVDTGSNRANRNTLGGGIATGDGMLALHARTLANITGIAAGGPLGLSVVGLNDITGTESNNKIRATVNDTRVLNINNLAWVDNLFFGLGNTGNNEASQNTLGGAIATGDLAADVGIDSLVNRVMLALAGGFAAGEAINLDAEFINQLTGALSENTNEAALDVDWLTDILNQGLVNNLVELLLNTGRNRANENTGGANILSGAGCVDGDVHNTVNQVTGGRGGSAALDNNGQVNNEAKVGVTTGSNEVSNNTGEAAETGAAGTCAKLAAAPDEEDDKAAAEEPTEDKADAGAGQGGDNGDIGPDEEKSEGRVAAAVSEADEKEEPQGKINGGGLLKRFPVAGGEDLAQLLPGEQRSVWPLFIVMSTLVLAGAYNFDRRAQAA